MQEWGRLAAPVTRPYGTCLARSPEGKVTEAMERDALEGPVEQLPRGTSDLGSADEQLEPNFSAERSDTTGLHDSGVDLDEEADTAYSPPMDPVVGTDQHGNVRVLGGFSNSSMDSVAVDRSSDGALGDEAIAEAILRELREDGATTGLQIDVTVRNGVARLRGRVADVTDSENVEEVAARVPGVKEVVEELTVESA